MTQDLGDHELLSRHLRGERDAFPVLVERHQRRIYAVCLRLLGSREDAADATQDAFVSAFRQAASFNRTAAFSTWLYRIAVNSALDLGRRRGRAPTTPLGPDEAGRLTAAGSDPADQATAAVAIQAALLRLPDDFRAAVVLCDLVGLPYAEASLVLGVPVGTVKSRVHRGRAGLAEVLGEEAVSTSVPAPDRLPGTGTADPASNQMRHPVDRAPGAIPPQRLPAPQRDQE